MVRTSNLRIVNGLIMKTNMKLRTVMAGATAVLFLASTALPAAEMTRLSARSGSKMRLEGTSNIHDWQVEAKLIGGLLEVGPNFPTEPGQNVTPGKVETKGEAWLSVNSLKSLEKDGRPYSDAMNDRMYEAMKKDANPKVFYFLDELTLKEVPKTKDAPYVFDAKGRIAAAGVTNQVSMPVNVTPLGDKDKRIKIAGTTEIKMTDFGIQPPSPPLVGSMIKTGDKVKIIFEWMVGPAKAAAAAAK